MLDIIKFSRQTEPRRFVLCMQGLTFEHGNNAECKNTVTQLPVTTCCLINCEVTRQVESNIVTNDVSLRVNRLSFICQNGSHLSPDYP